MEERKKPTETFLTPDELVERYARFKGPCAGTLANWRTKDFGPRWVKFGARVLYPLSEVIAYEQSLVEEITEGKK